MYFGIKEVDQRRSIKVPKLQSSIFYNKEHSMMQSRQAASKPIYSFDLRLFLWPRPKSDLVVCFKEKVYITP
jgi:hypothetical protein